MRSNWAPYVQTEEGLDRKFYELCVMAELRNALRAGDVWVPGSRQFRDFDEYLIEREAFTAQATGRGDRPGSDDGCRGVSRGDASPL